MALAQRQGDKAIKELLLEGPKLVLEALRSGWSPLVLILGPDEPLDLDGVLAEASWKIGVRKASNAEMERISRLKSAPSIMACFEIPDQIPVSSAPILEIKRPGTQASPWWLVAERIQDPGNLGTMIRIADWFGFEGLICSPDTVNCYNSKVIQASMGSLFRIPVHYVDINPVELYRLTGMNTIGLKPSKVDGVAEFDIHQGPWMVAAMPGGINLHGIQFPEQGGMLLVGNESQGLSQNVLQYATHRVGIPSYGNAESLNAAVAAGIFASAIRKK